MSFSFPYTYMSCPCSDESNRLSIPQTGARDLSGEEDPSAEEKTFNPHDPRSNFSLFPPEYLLYCEECHELKCPRCVIEEVVCWYCPSCLFETPSSMVRSEGNRCARNCFNCPICTSQLTVNTLTDAREGPWILNCNYCMWTSLDIGIQFDRPSNIRSQLDKIANGGQPRKSSSSTTKQPDFADPIRKSSLAREPFSPSSSTEPPPISPSSDGEPEAPPETLDPTARFAALKTFYKTQLALSSSDPATGLPSASDLAYSSPSSLARIVNLYTGLGSKKPKPGRTPAMREALTPAEGLLLPTSTTPSDPLQDFSWSSTPTTTQRHFQLGASGTGTPSARTVSALRPMPALLRTKRSKRCAACKHILVRPEFKPSSTRYRIKLTALDYIPLVSLKPLLTSRSQTNADVDNVLLQPSHPTQYILTLKNHLFDAVRVSLATPAVTPGKHGHKVTVLCPQFEVGANSDVWDDALNHNDNGKKDKTKGEVAEAGKIYDRGRNWTSVVLEVVPARIGVRAMVTTTATGKGFLTGEGTSTNANDGQEHKPALHDQDQGDEDEDVLEIPIRVRLEWRQSDVDEGGKTTTATRSAARPSEVGTDEARRELAYWMVLGVGRVAL